MLETSALSDSSSRTHTYTHTSSFSPSPSPHRTNSYVQQINEILEEIRETAADLAAVELEEG